MAALALVIACEQPVNFTDPTGSSLTQLVVFPDSIALDPAGTQQFAAFGHGPSGDHVPVVAQWTATSGSITSGGLYTADSSPNDAVITASLQGSTLTGSAHVRKRRIVRVSLTPHSVAISTGGRQQFTTYGVKNTGDSVSVPASYAAAGGAITGNGLFSAGQAGGTYRVIASYASGAMADTATVTVTPLAVASVAVGPTTATVFMGGSLQLTATLEDSTGTQLTGRLVAWSSGATGVATVDANGLVKGITAGTATITATSEGKSGTATVTVVNVPVASVQVAPASANVMVGQTAQFVATPKDSAGNPLTGRVGTWSSSATTIATVDANGLVKAVSPGTATITATSEGKSGTATVTVVNVPVASVQVAPTAANISVGQTVQLTATPKDSAGNPLTGRVGTWSSSAPAVAAVDVNGVVKGVSPGTATITATSEGKSGTATVTVATVPVASVSISPTAMTGFVGQTGQFTATPKDSAGNALTGRVVTWSSSAPGVATVDSTGLVRAIATGTATITVTSEGKSATATVTVANVPVASVSVSPASVSLQVGATGQLSAVTKDSTGATLTGRLVTWASSNTSVATVSPSGVVTAKAAGTATITATSEGKSGTTAITVAAVPVASVTLSPSTATIVTGGSQQLTATT
ncbi:MAG TPA: Ig-like domain-containing protein, partial [Gemmatimonadales bacterium]|nr:Ig-like domain-containing protein [Gemmatimonadales bacterium]